MILPRRWLVLVAVTAAAGCELVISPTRLTGPASDADVGPAASRTRYAWPFSRHSIWNLPLGAGAVHVAAGFDPGHDGYQHLASEPAPLALDPAAGLVPVYLNQDAWTPKENGRCEAQGAALASGRLPGELLLPGSTLSSTPGHHASFLGAALDRFSEAYPLTHCSAGQPFTAVEVREGEPLGGDGTSGFGPFGLPSLGGLLRLGELRPGQQGPRHALRVVLWHKSAFACGAGESCFRWPAARSDVDRSAYAGTLQALRPGALLALKPGAAAGLGLETEAGRQLAHALETYGAYYTQTTGWGAFSFATELSAAGRFTDQFKQDWGFSFEVWDTWPQGSAWARDTGKLVRALHVVDNNGPTSVGGGGASRACLAPPFADGLQDLVPENPNGSVTQPAGCP